jgi:predicted dehydrogenase
MIERKPRVAIIGAGWWSTFTHIPGLLHHPDAELAAVCDRSPDALAKAMEVYGPFKTYTDHRELLANERLEGVVVAVSHNAHYAVTKDCLDAGLHVMLEKPMTLKAVEAHALARLAEEKGLHLIVGYPWQYTAATRKAAEILHSGALGRVQYMACLYAAPVVEFFRANDEAYKGIFQYPVTGPGNAYADPKVSGGGQGHLQVTHQAAAMFSISGTEPDRVSAFMSKWDVPVDLVDAITVRCKPVDGYAAVAVLGSTGNMCAPCGTHFEVRVYCENGHVVLDQATGTVFARNHDGTEEVFGPLPPEELYPRFAPLNNLVELLHGRGVNGSPASVGVTVVEMLDAAYRSAADDGRPVSVAEVLAG